MSDNVNNVIVVGGGCAGSMIAAKLESSLPSNYRVILIEKRPFFYHTIGALRSAVEDFDIIFSYDKLFKKTGVLVQGEVISMTEQSVKVEPAHAQFGDVIPFSFLVIATGSLWCSSFLSSGANVEETKGILVSLRDNIFNSTNILLVGGGACGIELAGEIKEKYPTKKVMLIHSQPLLFNDRYPMKFRKAIQQSTEKRGVELILGDKVSVELDPSPIVNIRTITTQNGKEINTDLVISTIGARPNIGLMETIDSSLISPLGIKVRNTFQIDHPSINNIFVAGDAAGFNDCKGAYRAMHTHTPIVVHNINNLIKGKGKMKTYEPPALEDTILVTLGKKGGTSMLGGMVMGDFVTRTIKSKGLFVGSRQKDLGL